jgi:hypothetical protein
MIRRVTAVVTHAQPMMVMKEIVEYIPADAM